MFNDLKAKFKLVFQQEDNVRIFFAPGRVNLIGEHTDYNGGHVFPCALNIGTYVVVRARDDQMINMYSLNFEDKGIIQLNLQQLAFEKDHDWVNYPKGVIKEIQKLVNIPQGFDALFYGNIPNGAGLSSSASIELATAVMVNELFQLKINQLELVKLSQYAENHFIGVNCGIMDQFAIGMGKQESAVLLNCQTLQYEYSPLQLGEAKLVITNTNKRRALADSKYNERRSECDRALADLQSELKIESLGDLTPAEFNKYKHLIRNEIDRKRAKHAVYENDRTIKAVKNLKEGELKAFGELMNESHVSLKNDYEVTGHELDALVESAWKQHGVIGSRMTGAGFGGCTVSIVESEHIESFINNISQLYTEKTGLEADFYVVEVGDGARELVNEDEK
ncbi:galactokinase [Metabacillus arenae]|uniref:Galactokinase n=1 Tax=Metabacillus arenae TaxID=2771434 RepID=A0A926RWB6_9BACI|nr:galactokinase [Metabacillus arenae]MBD1379756.1 galactokinase [Metabacillus arenae]